MNDRKQLGVFLGPLRRQRPFLAESFLELRLEKGRLHAAVDDVPGQHRVAGSVAEDVEIAVDSGFRDRGAPVLAIALGRFDDGGDAAVAETGLDADFYIFRDRTNDAMLPWDIIDGGMKASFFHSEFDKGLREEWTLPPKRQQENARLLPMLN